MSQIAGSISGQSLSFNVSTQQEAGIANAVLAASTATVVSSSEVLNNYAPTSSGAAFSYFVADNASPATIVGSNMNTAGAIGATGTFGVLAGQGGAYYSGQSAASVIVAADNTNSVIANTNAGGSLIGLVGAGSNALVGFGTNNEFITSTNSVDAVLFGGGVNGQNNILVSNGHDLVSIYGSGIGVQNNVISVGGAAADGINLLNGAKLTFLNYSASNSIINVTDRSELSVVGTGSTTINAEGSAVSLTIDGRGSTTINGNVAGSETFNFVKLGTGASTGVHVISNFVASDAVNLVGFGGYNYSVDTTTVPGSTTITLSDKTELVFVGVTNSAFVTSRTTAY